MSTGLYSHTTRGIGTVLTAAIYNADHANHITNANPSMHGGYSDDVAQMRLAVDPGGDGSEVLADSLAGEIERIRFCLKRITGTTHWYMAPATNLGLIGGGLPLTLAFNSTPLTLRRTENNTSELEVQVIGAGSGAGNKFSRRLVGTGANAVGELRDYIGTTEIQRLTISLLTRFVAQDFRSYADVKEMTAPGAPAADYARFYARDYEGKSRLFYKQSDGVELMIGARARAYQEYTQHQGLTPVIPADDSVPSISEGTQILGVNLTLLNGAGKVRAAVHLGVSASANVHVVAALFRGSVCIAARAVHASDVMHTLNMEIEDTPGGAGPHNYTVRVGPSSTATIYINGNGSSGNRVFGGVAKATLTVEELPI